MTFKMLSNIDRLSDMVRGMRIALPAALVLAACGSSSNGDDGDDAPGDPDAPPNDPPDAPVSGTCEGRPALPADDTWQLDFGGTTRSVKVHVPPTYDPAIATPVVLNFHGYTMNAQWQADMTRMDAKSDAAGFIAIHVDGTGSPRGFNAGDCCGSAVTDDVDDVGLVVAILDRLASDACLDTARVYSTGFSNGGFLSHRLACELADRIVAIAPVSGVMGMDTCTPSRPVPVMQIHGTDDLIVPYDGGGLSGFRSVDDTVADWAARNGCTGAPEQTYQQGDATCVTHTGCTGGADVIRCTIDGGGHQWPGGEGFPGGGHLSTDLIATDAMWDFFASHSFQP
jgi:polyhydroxybutyrate depolymerase